MVEKAKDSVFKISTNTIWRKRWSIPYFGRLFRKVTTANFDGKGAKSANGTELLLVYPGC